MRHIYDLLALTLGASPGWRCGGRAWRRPGGAAARDQGRHRAGDRQGGRVGGSAPARHRLQVRYIQRLFETEGTTLTEYVTSRRLAKAHAMLADGRNNGLSISSVASRSASPTILFQPLLPPPLRRASPSRFARVRRPGGVWRHDDRSQSGVDACVRPDVLVTASPPCDGARPGRREFRFRLAMVGRFAAV